MGSSKLPPKTAFLRSIPFAVDSDEDRDIKIIFKHFRLDVKCNLWREEQSIVILHGFGLDRPVRP
jgi:hypothetical protein